MEHELTPGTWLVEEDDGTGAVMMGDSPCLCVTTANEHIAFVFSDKPANARLIAAAPDLLAACKAVEERGDSYTDMRGHGVYVSESTLDLIRTAIAKAKKGTP